VWAWVAKERLRVRIQSATPRLCVQELAFTRVEYTHRKGESAVIVHLGRTGRRFRYRAVSGGNNLCRWLYHEGSSRNGTAACVKRDGWGVLKAEVFGASNFVSRQSRFSRQSRLSQVSPVAAECSW